MSSPGALGTAPIEIGVVVRDVEAMSAFYGDVIGLERVDDLDFRGGTMRRYLHGDAVVKLVAPASPPSQSNPPAGPAGDASGLRYVSLLVGDIDAVVARCLDAGHAVPVPVFEFQPGIDIAMVEDPEGTWVELVQVRSS
jgi:catechol 2,3-dioxygenase-like lactoylglutathione lyase family enzyme